MSSAQFLAGPFLGGLFVNEHREGTPLVLAHSSRLLLAKFLKADDQAGTRVFLEYLCISPQPLRRLLHDLSMTRCLSRPDKRRALKYFQQCGTKHMYGATPEKATELFCLVKVTRARVESIAFVTYRFPSLNLPLYCSHLS
ncbi:hypothetical protein RRG08_053862 [Elysia crispata]|uniref:Uncharacterized protein n=1 Tax=Elysia crispata TaxID=231223 RepID=A0AAE0YMJ9_9GAST|nr:hypothetical protein RRG08_053862 [Elysia crispata]